MFNSDIRNGFIQYGQTLSSLKLITGDVASQTTLLASTVQNLTPKQQALALATKGVSQAQIAEVLQLNNVEKAQAQQALADAAIISRKKQLTMTIAQEALISQGLSAKKAEEIMQTVGLTAATETEAIAKKSVAKADLEAMLAQNGLNDAQIKAIMTEMGLGTATLTLSNYFKGLGASIVMSAKALGTFLLNPITLVTLAIAGAIAAVVKYNQKQEELRQEAEESAKAYDEQTKSLQDLRQQYIDIVDSEKSAREKTEELNTWKQTLIETYGFEKEALEKINLEREKSLGLLDDEIEKNNRVARNTYLEENKDNINTSYVKLGVNGAADWHTTTTDDSDTISSRITKLFNNTSVEDTGYNGMQNIDLSFNFDDAYDKLEKLKTIYNEFVELERERNLTASESKLFQWTKSQINDLEKVIEKWGTFYETSTEYNAANLYEDYLKTDEGDIEKVGKDTFLSWKNGLLEQAKNDGEKKELLKYIENQFPDLEKYYENISIAENRYLSGISDNTLKGYYQNWIESLSDEDLATIISEDFIKQFPDLFANGLDGAAEKIEEFNKNNPIEVNVDTKPLEKLKETYDELSKSASAFTKNQGTIKSAFEEQEKHGQLSADTIQSLIEAGYAQALMYDETTGAVTLNKQAVEQLNQQKREEVRLDAIKQKSDLEKLYQDEIDKINDKADAMRFVTAEARKQFILGEMNHNQTVKDIEEQLAGYDALIKSLDAPTFDNDTSSSSSDDSWKEEAEAKIKEIDHLYEMGEISEEERINRLEKLNQKYYANNEKYLDDYNKYEEEVYKYRQDAVVKSFEDEYKAKERLVEENKLTEQEFINWLDGQNENLFANKIAYADEYQKYEEDLYKRRKELAEKEAEDEQKRFEKRIDNYNENIDKAIDKHITGDGTELTVKGSFNYARSQANAAISDIKARIGNLSLIDTDEAREKIESLTDDLDDLYDKIEDINEQEIKSEKEYIETIKDKFSKAMDEKIDAIEKESEAVKDAYDKKIEAIDKEISAIEKVNEAEERQKEILDAQKAVKEAQKKLDEASVKNRLVLTRNGMWEARADEDAIKEAKEELEEAQSNLEKVKEEDKIKLLEESKSAFEKAKENADTYYSARVKALEEEKTYREKSYDVLIDILDSVGNKTQLSSNSDVYKKLNSSEDINTAVKNLSPSELTTAIKSGFLTVDDKGNYTFDYSAIEENTQAASELTKSYNETTNENTDAVNDLNELLKKFMPEKWQEPFDNTIFAENDKPTAKVPETSFDTSAIKNSSLKRMMEIIGSKELLKEFGQMYGNMVKTSPYGEMLKNVSSVMKDNSIVNNNLNNKPTVNLTVNVEGSVDEKTIERMKTEINNTMSEVFRYTTQAVDTAYMRQKKSK